MSELISTAPLYTKVRVHQSKIGNILCTGKGCIGCDRKYQIGEQDLSEILGEVDSVDFDKEEPRFLSSSVVFPDYEENTYRRHGNKSSILASVGAKNNGTKEKIQRRRKRGAKQNTGIQASDPRSDSALQKKNNKTDSFVIHNDNDVSKHSKAGNLKTTAKSKLKTRVKNRTVSFAVPLTRQRTFTVGEESRRSENSGVSTKSHERKSGHLISANTQCRVHARSRTYPLIAERKTHFLKMLQSSSLGIFDTETMRGKETSKWVEEALKSGVKQEELFPEINNKMQKSNFENISANKTREKGRVRTKDDNSTREKTKKSPKKKTDFADVGSSSILVIEHSHERANFIDDSLHKLGFRAQEGPRTKSFPGVSILEIAESLDDLVRLGAIKLIHEYEGRWYILVSSRIIRDFLIQSGVTLRGRRFEMVECSFNSSVL